MILPRGDLALGLLDNLGVDNLESSFEGVDVDAGSRRLLALSGVVNDRSLTLLALVLLLVSVLLFVVLSGSTY